MYAERRSRLAGGFVWTRRCEATDSVIRVLPDGCMDLIWDGQRLSVAGPDTTAQLTARQRTPVLTGLRFPPGFGPRVIGVPAHEFTDRRVPLDEVWSSAPDVGRATDVVAGSTDPGRALEDVALDLGRDAAPAGGLESLVVGRLHRGDTVAMVADEVGLSTRQLHRRCVEAFGYGAKTLARILRMITALELARAGHPLAATAARAGYADQAHLTREVRRLAGVPPRQLVASAGNEAKRSTELPSGSWTLA